MSERCTPEASGTLAELRAKREELDAAIKQAETEQRESWNIQLSSLEDALKSWLGGNNVSASWGERKNERIVNAGHGALEVRFGYDEPGYGPWLQLTSGKTLRLEWTELPRAARFIAIVRALLAQDS